MNKGVLVAVLGIGFSAVSQADQVPKPWPDMYAQIAAALGHKDVKAYGAFLDKSFVFTDSTNKTQHLDEYLKGIANSLKQVSNVKTVLTPSDFHKQGDEILLTYHYHFEADIKGGRHLRFFEQGTDTWRKVGGKYLEVKEVATQEGLMPDKPGSGKKAP